MFYRQLKRQIGNFGKTPDSAKFSDQTNSFYFKFHLDSVASISVKNSKNVIMSKYSLARKLFGLEESDPDDSERSVIYISSIKIALQIQSSLWLELRGTSPPAPC